MKYLQSFSLSRFEVSSERSDSDCQNQFQFLYFDEVFQERTNEKAAWPIQIDFQDPEIEFKILERFKGGKVDGSNEENGWCCEWKSSCSKADGLEPAIWLKVYLTLAF